ncbi:TPA: hypothetical protein LA827_003275 [Clostridium botulinum]|nr:hypothetical protein [Clostridium botulinum]
MKYTIRENSHTGIGLFILELIITMICLNGILELFKIKTHPAIRIVICIIAAIIIFLIFAASKIGCIIVSLLYSSIWTILAWNITKECTKGDKIWMSVISGIIFLISIGIHFSTISDSGYDYEITKVNEN